MKYSKENRHIGLVCREEENRFWPASQVIQGRHNCRVHWNGWHAGHMNVMYDMSDFTYRVYLFYMSLKNINNTTMGY